MQGKCIRGHVRAVEQKHGTARGVLANRELDVQGRACLQERHYNRECRD
jgi:hypothetical protein